ncbi:hypothetical protein [Chitinophaga nivalis]|uniref:DUF3575 domain-containing protein n=1 Tax=Chitinophaga nivalis TaxID=2991709 RepID=A0ABT3IUN9_9BACT|nr:hypothetical protein [Chitinophaga nivalis]MCW3462597.1 hypothetical protein [Chitinophaga nivalis]MCW3487712.1 hypothetical protein [Chitinophaga nivalis]
MSKRLFSRIVTGLLLMNLCAVAQDSLDRKASQFKANLNLLGVGLHYEWRVYRTATMNLEAGIDFSFGYAGSDMNGSHWGYIFTPVVSGEFRQYYGLRRSAAHGRKIRNNAGNFFSLTAGYSMVPLIAKNKEMDAMYSIAPAWGIQRSWGKRINFDVRFGWALRYISRTGSWDGFPSTRLGVGYVIW